MVYGVSFDDQDANRRFAEKYQFNFDLLCDTSRQLGLAYGACTDPHAETATRISYIIGPDGLIRKSYPKVVPADHPQQVLDDLDQL